MNVKIVSAFLAAVFMASCAGPEIKLGVCTVVPSAAEIDPDSTGCSYVEVSVSGTLIPEKPDSVFAPVLQKIRDLKVPVRAANGFFPGSIKLVGPDVDTARIRKYVTVAMQRAHEVGIGVVVLGSGHSRRIPEGMERSEAVAQFEGICRTIAAIAAENGVTIALEPLNSAETDFINTTLEGAEIVRDVNHPNFKLLADFFHMARSGEDPYANLVAVSDCLCHCHIAENANRTAPGVAGDDFTPYFKALKDISYDGCISIECSGLQDMDHSLASSISYIKQFIQLKFRK